MKIKKSIFKIDDVNFCFYDQKLNKIVKKSNY